eukprot:scaffold15633_cov60-Phaeocystis_antarctica.AAC.4
MPSVLSGCHAVRISCHEARFSPRRPVPASSCRAAPDASWRTAQAQASATVPSGSASTAAR